MNKSKHIICVSGGGTKALGLSTVLENVLREHGMPKAYVGTSSGSIIALPMLMGKYEEVRHNLINAEQLDFFDQKLNAVAAIKMGYSGFVKKQNNIGLSSMHNLANSIRSLVSNEEYEKFRSEKNRPEIYVGTVNIDTGDMRYIPLFDYKLDEALQWITASSSIPVMAEPVYGKYLDGGLRHHIGSKFLLGKYGMDVDECHSIYSRPKDLSGVLNPDNFIFSKTLSIMMHQISKSDESVEKLMAKDLNVDLHQYFIPKAMDGFYDLNSENLNKLETLAKAVQPITHKFNS